MALIEWKDAMSVNVAEIDRQHQKLISLINDLNEAMKQRKAKEVIGDIVNGLADYTVMHFKMEEKYFDQFGYPDTAAHKKEHAEFVSKVSDFNEGFKDGRLGLSIEVMQFLSDWLKKHIMGTDKKYAQFFNEKGLK